MSIYRNRMVRLGLSRFFPDIHIDILECMILAVIQIQIADRKFDTFLHVTLLIYPFLGFKKIIRSECKVCLHGNVKCMKKMGTRDLPHVPIHKM